MSHGSFKESLRVPTERLQVFRMKGHCFACQLIVYFLRWIESASARDPAQRRFVRPSIDKTDGAMNGSVLNTASMHRTLGPFAHPLETGARTTWKSDFAF